MSGRLDDQCRESVPCECGYTRPCVLKLGHDGKHTAKGHT